jgi:hypothetical protein
MPSWIGGLRKRTGSSISTLVQPNIVPSDEWLFVPDAA